MARTLFWPGVAAGVEYIGALQQRAVRTVVDIGANRGQFALIARHCFPQGEDRVIRAAGGTREMLSVHFHQRSRRDSAPGCGGAGAG